MLVPVGTAAAAHLFGGSARPRALGVVGALTFLGMAAGPVVGAAILSSVHPAGALAAAGVTGTAAAILDPAWRWVFYINIPHRDHRHRPCPGRLRRLGDAATAGAGGHRRGGLVRRGPGRRPDRPDPARLDRDRRDERAAGGRDRCAARGRGGRDCGGRRARPAGARPVPRPAALPERAVQLGRARLAADRLRLRDRDHRRRGVRRPGPVRRPGRPAAGARGARRWRPRSGRSPRASSSASCRSRSSRWSGSGSASSGSCSCRAGRRR